MSEIKLITQVRQGCRTRHLSKSTEESYVNWIKKYIYYHNITHPSDMGKREIESFLSHLAPFICHAPFGKWLRY